MSDNQHHDHDGDNGGGGDGGPNTQFLDFELDKVMYDEAESVVREAFRELLKDAAKRRVQEVWGQRIEALARLAVDEALADNDANFAIQAQIAARNDAKRALEDKIKSIINGSEGDAAEGEAEGDAGEGGDPS